MSPTNEQILNALRSVQDPDLHQDLVTLGFIKDLQVDGGRVAFTIELTTPACPVKDLMRDQAQRAVEQVPGVSEVQVRLSAQVRASIPQQGVGANPLPNLKNIIPIASGKGGVGKSTVSANLACALARSGSSVGIMDADVYGPSIPTILGVKELPESDEHNRIYPVTHESIKIISMGFFMKPEEAVIWRGPMLHKTVQQFLGGVIWGDLDYLIVDLPPGTGDVQLSLCQSIPITGAVIVSTPQDVALNVAQKAVAMFKKLNAPILGLIENMSYYECPRCGKRDDIFGSGGAQRVAQQSGFPFLGAIPLATPVRRAADEGRPIVNSDPESALAKAFIAAAEQLAAQASIRALQPAKSPKVSY